MHTLSEIFLAGVLQSQQNWGHFGLSKLKKEKEIINAQFKDRKKLQQNANQTEYNNIFIII